MRNKCTSFIQYLLNISLTSELAISNYMKISNIIKLRVIGAKVRRSWKKIVQSIPVLLLKIFRV